MSTAEQQPDRDPVEVVAESFLERYRRGERPSLSEYQARYPELAEKIGELFPALAMMEDAAPAPADRGDSLDGCRETGARIEEAPRQLGEFRILREVARGGMGVVYEAEQASLGRRVALKVLPRQMFRDPKQKKRFQREARAAAGLHHTNIVPVFGVGEENGLCYYAMQFIHGQSLDEVLGELKRMANVQAGSRQAEDADRKHEVAHPRPEIGDDAPHTEPADRQGDVSAADVAQSLLTGRFRRTVIACDDSDDQSPDGPAAEPSNAPHPPDASPDVDQTTASDTATAGLADTAKLSGAAILPGQSESDATCGAKTTYWQSVSRIGVQAAGALQHAHEHGILHRDVKPGNLLLDTAGTVWVTDFGLAKAEDEADLTGTGDVIGTLRYMAPEVFEGTTDERSDVCSLGLTLYEMLALRPAFDQTDRHRLVRQVMTKAPPRLRAVNPDVPRDLELIVHKAIDRDPATRYQTAGELAAELQRFLNDEPIRARRISPIVRLTRWCRRKPAVASLTASVAMLVVVIAIGASIAALTFRQQRDSILAHRQTLQQTNEELRSAQENESQAKQEATRKLWRSYFSEAQARRFSGRAGQRLESHQSLHQAAELLPSLGLSETEQADRRLKLRNEAIASMPLTDVSLVRTRLIKPINQRRLTNFVVDPQFELYAVGDRAGNISVRQVTDDRKVARFSGPRCRVRVSGFGPQGRFLAAYFHTRGLGQSAEPLYIWDLRSRELVLKVKGIARGHKSFSPDGRLFAVALRDGSIALYELPAGRLVKRLPAGGQGSEYAIAFHPDGTTIAVAHGNRGVVQVHDIETGKTIETFSHPKRVDQCAWSPDGRLLAAACSDYRAYVWDINRPQEPSAVLTGHQAEVVGVAFHPSGDVLATRSWDATTRFWDPRSGRQLLSIPGKFRAFSPDGESIGGATEDHTLAVMQIVLGRECRTLHESVSLAQKGPWSADFSPDGALMLTACYDGVRLWETSAGKELVHLPIGLVRTAFFATDGQSFFTGGQQGLYRWPISLTPRRMGASSEVHGAIGRSEDRPRRQHQGSERYTIAPTPQPAGAPIPGRAGIRRAEQASSRLGDPARAHAPDSGSTLHIGPPEHLTSNFSTDWACLSADGQTVAAVPSHSGHVHLIPLQGNRAVKTLPAQTGLTRVTFSLDGRYLAGGSFHGRGVRVWDAKTGKVIKDLIPQEVNSKATFSPDAKWVITSTEEKFRFWKIGTWEPGRTIQRISSSNTAGCLTYSPEGHTLAVAVSERVIKLLRAATGEELATLRHPNPQRITNLSFSPDGRFLAATTERHRVHLWNIGQIRAQLAAMNLDWDTPQRTLSGRGPQGVPLPVTSVEVDLGELDESDAAGSSLEDTIVADSLRESSNRSLSQARVLVQRADDAARRGQWQQAADAFSRALQLYPHEHWHWFRSAPVQLWVGRLDEYRRHCRELLDRFGDTEDPFIAERTAKICLISPERTGNEKTALKLADRAVSARPDVHYFQLAKGIAEYRLNRYRKSIEWLKKADAGFGGDPKFGSLTFLFLSMAHHRRGHEVEARHSWEAARRLMADPGFPALQSGNLGDGWNDWLICQIVRREAERLLQAPSPAVAPVPSLESPHEPRNRHR